MEVQHLGWCYNPVNIGINYPIKWCRNSSINSIGPPCRDPDSLAQEVEKNSDSQEVARLKKARGPHGVCCRYFVLCFDGLFLSSLRQYYPTLKLLGSTYSYSGKSQDLPSLKLTART